MFSHLKNKEDTKFSKIKNGQNTFKKMQLNLFYHDKETTYFNLYKFHSLVRMMVQGRRLCGRKPEY